MDRKGRQDPIAWRNKILVLYRTILQLRAENKYLSRQVKRLERKIKTMEKRKERKEKIIEWFKKVFCFKK